MKVIRCNCRKECLSKICSCRKNGLFCTYACWPCQVTNCFNIQVDDGDNNFERDVLDSTEV